MKKLDKEKPALLIIDMVKDNFDESKKLMITQFAKKTIEPLNRLICLRIPRPLGVVRGNRFYQIACSW